MVNTIKVSADNLNWHIVFPKVVSGWTWQQGREYMNSIDMFDIAMRTVDETWPGIGPLIRRGDRMTCCGGYRWVGPGLLSTVSQKVFWGYVKQAACAAGLELGGKIEIYREVNCFKAHAKREERGPIRPPVGHGLSPGGVYLVN